MIQNFIIILTVLVLSNGQLLFAKSITITAVGDTRLSKRFIENRIDELKTITLKGDLIIANFEGVLASKQRKHLTLTMPLNTIKILKCIGINTLSLSNNHVLDLGYEAYDETCRLLLENDFNVSGLYGIGTVVKIKNKKIRFIAFSFSGVNNVNDIANSIQTISLLSEEIIIVSAHMGGEESKGYLIPSGMEYFYDEKRGNVRAFSKAVIDAGADLVLGHGPHVLREIELYKKRLIVYSLGNFIFDYPGVDRHSSSPGYVLSVQLNKDGEFVSGKIDSYSLYHGIPKPDKRSRALFWIQSLSKGNGISFKQNGEIFLEER